LIYAGLHLFLSLPLQMAVIRKSIAARADVDDVDDAEQSNRTLPLANEKLVFGLLALILSITASVGSVVVVHLLIFLQGQGASFSAAVTLGTLFGPAQVCARVVERVFGSRYHPIWTLVASCLLMAVGLMLLFASFPLLAVVIILYGAGYGVSWIARGTLPLALFGPVRFPRLMGKLAFPSLIAQALAPSAGAVLVEHVGSHATIGVLTVFAAINVVLIGVLWAACRPRLAVAV
jgi:MFS family permease